MRRKIALLLTFILLIGSVMEVSAANEGSASQGETEQTMPTGRLETKVNYIPMSEIGEESIESDEDIQIYKSQYRSQIYNYDWDKYSTNYFYNQLSSEEKALWDRLDGLCLSYLTSTRNAEYTTINNTSFCRTALVSIGNLDISKVMDVAYMFRISNPQYYFLDNQVCTSYIEQLNGYRKYTDVGFGIYTAFQNGSARKTATAAVKSQVNAWETEVAACSTEIAKVKKIHDLICNKVIYNGRYYNNDFDEDTEYSQSAYSVFCLNETVCAGYSQAFTMMCNGAGIDTIAVTSDTHQWNKIRLNDSWYNMDLTWDDGSTIYYEWFARSDSYYDNGQQSVDHQEESYWNSYLPSCTLDAKATSPYSTPGTLPTVTKTTATPVISLQGEGNATRVTITSSTPGAIIYYTTDGTEPSPAYTKALKYTSSFTTSNPLQVKAVAVCDTYLDSSVAGVTAYTVQFNPNGGSGSMAPQVIACGSGNKLSANTFVRSGYSFNGWNTNPDGTGTACADGADGSMLSSANGATVTLYAQWKENSAAGWQNQEGTWNYYDDAGNMQTGWQSIGGTWYYFDDAGNMQTGWVYSGGRWYYMNSSGAMAEGWLYTGGTWYYLIPGSGAMAEGWIYSGGAWYYLTPGSGAMCTGWYNAGGTWYYSSSSGAMQTGWVYSGGTWYYLTSSGAMAQGWIYNGGAWYYLTPGSGAMCTGWYNVGGTWYYSYGSGAMAANTWIGRYYVNASGAWTRTR